MRDHPTNVSILLVEGRKLLREALRALLERHDDLKVVAEAEDGGSATKLIEALDVHVLVLNINPPQHGCVEVVQSISAEYPAVRVLVLMTMDPTATLLRELLKAGAHGCLTREASATELVEAIRTVVSGQNYLSPHLVNVMVEGYARPARRHGPAAPPRPLAPREREILQRIAGGETTKEIARALGVGTKTVETHRRRLMQKLNKHSVAELTKYAVLEGLTPLESASQPR